MESAKAPHVSISVCYTCCCIVNASVGVLLNVGMSPQESKYEQCDAR